MALDDPQSTDSYHWTETDTPRLLVLLFDLVRWYLLHHHVRLNLIELNLLIANWNVVRNNIIVILIQYIQAIKLIMTDCIEALKCLTLVLMGRQNLFSKLRLIRLKKRNAHYRYWRNKETMIPNLIDLGWLVVCQNSVSPNLSVGLRH